MVNNFRQVSNILKKEGWEVVRVAGSHYQFRKEGCCSTVTVPYHPGKTLSLNVIKSIEKQSGLSLRR